MMTESEFNSNIAEFESLEKEIKNLTKVRNFYRPLLQAMIERRLDRLFNSFEDALKAWKSKP